VLSFAFKREYYGWEGGGLNPSEAIQEALEDWMEKQQK